MSYFYLCECGHEKYQHHGKLVGCRVNTYDVAKAPEKFNKIKKTMDESVWNDTCYCMFFKESFEEMIRCCEGGGDK